MGREDLIPPEYRNAPERTPCSNPDITGNVNPNGPQSFASSLQAIQAMVRGNLASAIERNAVPGQLQPVDALFYAVRTETMNQLQQVAPQQDMAGMEVIVRLEADRLETLHNQVNIENRAGIVELVQRAFRVHLDSEFRPLHGPDGDVDLFVNAIATLVLNDLDDFVHPSLQIQLRDIVYHQMMTLRLGLLAQRQGQQQLRPQPQDRPTIAGGVGDASVVGAPIGPDPQTQGQRPPDAQPQQQGQVPVALQGQPASVNMGQNGMSNVGEDGGGAVAGPSRTQGHADQQHGHAPPVAPANVPNAPDATGKTRLTHNWDPAPGHTKTSDQNYKVKCPECPAGHKLLIARSMLYHFRRHHRDEQTYARYYGGPPPALVPCPVSDCSHPGFKAKKDVPDHLLTVHGVEREEHRKNTSDLRRMRLSLLVERLAAEAKALNELKRRIREAEARLHARGGYVSRHGLDVTRVWAETDPTVGDEAAAEIARLRAEEPTRTNAPNFYVANILQSVRIEADEVGRLQGGDAGSYIEVAEELERLDGGESADEVEGEDGDEDEMDIDEQEDSEPQADEEEDDIYNA